MESNTMKRRSTEGRKVFVLGVDGATFDVIQPLVEKGDLPNFGKMMKEGAWGELESVIPPSSGPAWTSFQTGRTPSSHSIFDFVVKKANSYGTMYINASHIKGPRIWDVLGKYGLKSGVINVMVTYPPREINGFMLTGGLTPEGKGFAYPQSLAKEIEDRFGSYRLWGVGGITLTDGGEERFIQSYFSNEKRRMDIARYMLGKQDWDFFMVMLESADPLQHELWKYIDPNHPRFDPNAPDAVKGAIVDFYREVDAFLGEMMQTLPEETTFCIMSDHGFGPMDRYFLVNNFLIDIGMLKLKKSITGRAKRMVFDRFSLERLYRLARKMGMNRAAKHFRGGVKEKMLSTVVPSFRDIDWSRTKAFAIGASGHIYLNVKGREPEGIVDPDREYYQIRDHIIENLLALKDTKSDQQVVERAFTKDELHSGQFAVQAPDISFLPARGYSTLHREQFISPDLFIDSPSCGTHRLQGICLFHGPTIQKGKRIEGARIFDLAPTILQIYGLPVPTQMDGKVLEEVFEEMVTPPARESFYREAKGTGRLTDQLKRLRDSGKV